MKRFAVFSLSLFLTVGFLGCGQGDTNNTSGKEDPSHQQPQQLENEQRQPQNQPSTNENKEQQGSSETEFDYNPPSESGE